MDEFMSVDFTPYN